MDNKVHMAFVQWVLRVQYHGATYHIGPNSGPNPSANNHSGPNSGANYHSGPNPGANNYCSSNSGQG